MINFWRPGHIGNQLQALVHKKLSFWLETNVLNCQRTHNCRAGRGSKSVSFCGRELRPGLTLPLEHVKFSLPATLSFVKTDQMDMGESWLQSRTLPVKNLMSFTQIVNPFGSKSHLTTGSKHMLEPSNTLTVHLRLRTNLTPLSSSFCVSPYSPNKMFRKFVRKVTQAYDPFVSLFVKLRKLTTLSYEQILVVSAWWRKYGRRIWSCSKERKSFPRSS